MCHRASRISHTQAGVRESALHLLQWFEVALPALLVLTFGVRLWTVAVSGVFVILHAWTAWYDELTARPHRFISITENHCHAFLNSVPVIAWGLAAWAVVVGERLAPMPPWTFITAAAVVGGSGALITEEFHRCCKQAPHRALS